MDVGITLPIAVPGAQPEVLLEWARRVDDSPFASLGVNDRLVWRGYEPFTTLSAAAGLTRRVKLITHVIISPVRNGGLLAKQVATLDALSGGRLILGIGVGGAEDDYAAAPADFHRRGRNMDWQISAMKRVWAGEPIAEGIEPFGPAPGRPGGPPILVGGRTPRPLQRAGRVADGYMAGTANTPQQLREYFDVVQTAWREAARPGRPLFAAIDYYALGHDALPLGQAYIREYYARQGPRAQRSVDRILSSPEIIRERLKGFAGVGVDDYILIPTVATLDQFDRLAEVVASH